jgi:hypothetical protein
MGRTENHKRDRMRPKVWFKGWLVFGLTKVKALAHLRYYFPPAGIIRTAATGPIDPRIPIAASRIWLLAPHHELKVSEARMLGKLFFQLQVERDDVDQGTCHECPDGCY